VTIHTSEEIMSNQRNNLLVKRALSPALRTDGAVNGVTIDRAEDNCYFQDLLFGVQTGTITDGTHAVTIEDSDDGTTFGAVSAGNLQDSLPSIVAANDDVVYAIGYLGTKRYARIVVTAAGTTTGGIVGAVALLGRPRNAPVTQDN
jgi:hypothetical protein